MGSMLLVTGVRTWLSSYKQGPKIASLHLFFIFKLSLKLVLAKAECLLEPGPLPTALQSQGMHAGLTHGISCVVTVEKPVLVVCCRCCHFPFYGMPAPQRPAA